MNILKDLTYIFWPGRGGLGQLHWLRCLANQPEQNEKHCRFVKGSSENLQNSLNLVLGHFSLFKLILRQMLVAWKSRFEHFNFVQASV